LYQASSNPRAGALVCIRALFLWHIWLQESIRTVEPQHHLRPTPSEGPRAGARGTSDAA